MKKTSIKLLGMDISWDDMKQVFLALIVFLSLVFTLIGLLGLIPIGVFIYPSFETVGWGLLILIFGGLFFIHFGEKLCEPWRRAKP